MLSHVPPNSVRCSVKYCVGFFSSIWDEDLFECVSRHKGTEFQVPSIFWQFLLFGVTLPHERKILASRRIRESALKRFRWIGAGTRGSISDRTPNTCTIDARHSELNVTMPRLEILKVGGGVQQTSRIPRELGFALHVWRTNEPRREPRKTELRDILEIASRLPAEIDGYAIGTFSKCLVEHRLEIKSFGFQFGILDQTCL